MQLASSSEDYDCTPIGESETEDGLSGNELVSDDEEYVGARKNKNKVHSEFQGIQEEEASQEVANAIGFISNYESSSAEINSELSGSEGEEVGGSKKHKIVTYDPKCDHKSMKVVIGMRFMDAKQCKHAIHTIFFENGYPIHFTRFNKKQREAKCISECGWKCYGALQTSDCRFVIKMVQGEHKFPRVMNNKQATANWISDEYLEVIRERPNIKISKLQSDFMKRFAGQVGKWRLYRAKWKALEKLRGSMSDHYGKLRSYIMELMRVDREGRFELALGDKGVFEAFYVGFSALKKGFLGGVDLS